MKIKKSIISLIWATLTLPIDIYSSDIYTDFENNPFWQAAVIKSGYRQGDMEKVNKAIAQRLKSSASFPLSKDEHDLYYGRTALGAVRGINLPKSSNPGVNVLLLEDSGITRPDIRVNPASCTQPAESFI